MFNSSTQTLALYMTAMASLVLVASACKPALVSGGACANTGDCPENEVCFQEQCRFTCNYQRDCRSNEHCSEGMCLPGAAQLADAAHADILDSDIEGHDSGYEDSARLDVESHDQLVTTEAGMDSGYDSGVDAGLDAGSTQDASTSDSHMTDLQSTDNFVDPCSLCADEEICNDDGICHCNPNADMGHQGCPLTIAQIHMQVSCGLDSGENFPTCHYICIDDTNGAEHWQNCDSDDGNGCETDVKTDVEHCGSCNNPARVFLEPTDLSVLLSNRCVDGHAVCGSQSGSCDGVAGTNYLSGLCFEDSTEGNTEAYCVNCSTSAAVLCGEDSFCCRGECIDEANAHCGCGPAPGSDTPSINCTSYNIGTEDENETRHGRVCVDATGAPVTKSNIENGVCGCTIAGPTETECGVAEDYNNSGYSASIPLAGLCQDNHKCRTQNASNCGVVGGVISASGVTYLNSSCNPAFGGSLCEDDIDVSNDNISKDLIGTCGCGEWNQSVPDQDESCEMPVAGMYRRFHVVANQCKSYGGQINSCVCGDEAGPCNTLSDNADCCDAGCTDMATDVDNCGQCATVCHGWETAVSSYPAQCGDSSLAPGQCACAVSSTGTGDMDGACPDNGGGGGVFCSNGACVCQQAGNAACGVGEWCVDSGTSQVSQGYGSGCCDNAINAKVNRCELNTFCTGNDPVLCVSRTARTANTTSNEHYICCPTGSICDISDNVLSCGNSTQ